MRYKNMPILGLFIKEKGIEFSEKLGHNRSIASIGWLDTREKKRYGLLNHVEYLTTHKLLD